MVSASVKDVAALAGDVLGATGPGRTILTVTVDNWLIDEMAALGSDVADRELENAL